MRGESKQSFVMRNVNIDIPFYSYTRVKIELNITEHIYTTNVNTYLRETFE
jgi:hypothetical protein